MKIYFKSGKGIEKPIDFNGEEIKEGDTLTSDYFDDFFDESYYKKHYPTWTKEMIHECKHKPTYKVKWNDRGYFYAEGIKEPTWEFGSKLYLHDFRFKHTKIIKK